MTCNHDAKRCRVCPVKTKWILACLLLAATLAASWFLRPQDAGKILGTEAHALTGEILALGPRPPGSEGLDKARALLAKELEATGWSVKLQEFEQDTPIGKIRFVNLRARFSKQGDPWKATPEGLLCAHLDSKYYENMDFLGADDAASACAAAVEIAKHLSRKHPDQAAKLELVLFDGEESFTDDMTMFNALYGSRHYANLWRRSDEKPRFGILLDMIGHKDLAIRIPSDSPENLAKLMFSAAEKEGVSRYFGTAPGPIIDDHVPLNLVGIPTLDIIGDFANKRWWHTPGDNASIVTPESLGISISVVLRMLDELLDES